MSEKLKQYMEENFPFTQFKKVKFFSPEMKNDFEAQAKKVCEFFGIESVYDYTKIGWNVPVHISYATPRHKEHTIPVHRKFVEVINGPKAIIGGKMKPTKIIPFNEQPGQ